MCHFPVIIDSTNLVSFLTYYHNYRIGNKTFVHRKFESSFVLFEPCLKFQISLSFFSTSVCSRWKHYCQRSRVWSGGGHGNVESVNYSNKVLEFYLYIDECLRLCYPFQDVHVSLCRDCKDIMLNATRFYALVLMNSPRWHISNMNFHDAYSAKK